MPEQIYWSLWMQICKMIHLIFQTCSSSSSTLMSSVVGEKIDRIPIYLEPFPPRLPSLISRLSNVYLHDYGCTLRIYRKEFIQDIPLYGEMHRFIPIYVTWAGARLIEVPVKHHPRTRGVSKYGLWRPQGPPRFNHPQIPSRLLCHAYLFLWLAWNYLFPGGAGFDLLRNCTLGAGDSSGARWFLNHPWSDHRRFGFGGKLHSASLQRY